MRSVNQVVHAFEVLGFILATSGMMPSHASAADCRCERSSRSGLPCLQGAVGTVAAFSTWSLAPIEPEAAEAEEDMTDVDPDLLQSVKLPSSRFQNFLTHV